MTFDWESNPNLILSGPDRKAWHFLGVDVHNNPILRNGDPIPNIGEWLEYEGVIQLRKAGLHASENIEDALMYAPGTILCAVECAPPIAKEKDQLVCQKRKILWWRDISWELKHFYLNLILEYVNHLGLLLPNIDLNFLRSLPNRPDYYDVMEKIQDQRTILYNRNKGIRHQGYYLIYNYLEAVLDKVYLAYFFRTISFIYKNHIALYNYRLPPYYDRMLLDLKSKISTEKRNV